MVIDKKTREQLKAFFVKNAIPTESNFADLIDAGLNQMDDGISKPDGNPLCIQAVGDTKKVINFYADPDTPNPEWSLALNPRSKANDSSSARPGFAVTDSAGAPRLFIDAATGHVGLGTNEPTVPLTLRLTKAGNLVGFTQGQVGGTATLELTTADSKSKQATRLLLRGAADACDIEFYRGARAKEALSMVVAGATGNVGIGTPTPAARLNIVGGSDSALAGGGFLVLGAQNTANISIDNNEIMARNNGVKSPLYLQADGGDLQIHRGSTSLVVKDDGNVGVGTLTPGEKLQVQDGDIRITGGRYRRLKIISDKYWAGIELVAREKGEAGNPHIDFTHGDLDTPNFGIRLYAPNNDLLEVTGGNLKVPKLQLGGKWLMSGIGDGHGNDTWLRLMNTSGSDYHGGLAAGKLYTKERSVQLSDARLKEDIRTIEQPNEKLSRLRGVVFRWRTAEPDSSPQMGLIAQEVEAVFPELVERGPDGMKALDYSGLIAPLIEAIKEQGKQIETLTRQVENLGLQPSA